MRCPRQILAIARPRAKRKATCITDRGHVAYSRATSLLPRIQAPKLDEVQSKRLDLCQYAVQGRTIQNTRENCVRALHLRDHRRKRSECHWAKLAGDPNRVHIWDLTHVHILSIRQVRTHRHILARF